jgi:tRNA threonylcarbamoyladenosine biosynthesis protein TsaB
MNLLAFDTSTDLLCASLMAAAPDQPVRHFELCLDAGLRHAELLIDSLDQLCRLAGMERRDISAIACGRGPGSFTGLRIGMAGAKGMAAALGIPLASVSALDAIHHRQRHWPGPVLALIDARKQRFYAGLYLGGQRLGGLLDLDHAGLLALLDTAGLPAGAPVLLTGPDAGLFLERLGADPRAAETRSHLQLVLDPSGRKGWGRELAELEWERIQSGNWDPVDFGPEYVRSSDAELGIALRKPREGAQAQELPG